MAIYIQLYIYHEIMYIIIGPQLYVDCNLLNGMHPPPKSLWIIALTKLQVSTRTAGGKRASRAFQWVFIWGFYSGSMISCWWLAKCSMIVG